MIPNNSLREYCIKNGRDELLTEWNAVRNTLYYTDCVSFNFHIKVWWRCSLGHEWQAVIKRYGGSAVMDMNGAPKCFPVPEHSRQDVRNVPERKGRMKR